jgi:hypothetical protein
LEHLCIFYWVIFALLNILHIHFVDFSRWLFCIVGNFINWIFAYFSLWIFCIFWINTAILMLPTFR